MSRPIPILLVAFLGISGSVRAQSISPCKEIKVEYKTEHISTDKSKVILQFGSNQNADDFTLSLFGERRNRRLFFSALEKLELGKGEYILIIQSKKDESFCNKQINLKLE